MLAKPTLIPKDKDPIVDCTCPSDEISRVVLCRAFTLWFFRMKFLKGEFAAWKAKGSPIEPHKGVLPTSVPRSQ